MSSNKDPETRLSTVSSKYVVQGQTNGLLPERAGTLRSAIWMKPTAAEQSS